MNTPTQRRLWSEADETDNDDNHLNENGSSSYFDQSTIEELRKRFTSRPPLKSFLSLCQSTWVVGQEFVLVAYFLARHDQSRLEEMGNRERENDDDLNQVISHLFVLFALLLILIFNNEDDDDDDYNNSSSTTVDNDMNLQQQQQRQPRRRIKIQQRSMDALLLALLLRLLAAVLRTLTESFSSDTVHALANAGLILHLLTCDYSYANGCGGGVNEGDNKATATSSSATLQKRPAFLGGTISLNAAFFSTTLLASRLSSNSQVYFFVSLSVVVFAFYPAARHGVSQHVHGPVVHFVVLVALFVATVMLLPTHVESYLLACVLGTVCFVAPVWKYYLQRYKQVTSGPWDVVKLQNIVDTGDQKKKKE